MDTHKKRIEQLLIETQKQIQEQLQEHNTRAIRINAKQQNEKMLRGLLEDPPQEPAPKEPAKVAPRRKPKK